MYDHQWTFYENIRFKLTSLHKIMDRPSMLFYEIYPLKYVCR